jgi:tetratricopeptide (TPR) repeat protein
VRIWDSATGEELVALKGHAGLVTSVAFSPDGQRLASGSGDRTVRIWHSETGKELVAFKVHAVVWSVAFSPDGRCLACNGEDGSIELRETNVTPEMEERRAVHRVVADLFGQLNLRSEVVEQLRTAPGLSPSQRQEAIAAAGTYAENPPVLNDRAWELVKLPGRPMFVYRKAVRYSEKACELESTKGLYLHTLGVAYYRVGNYEKALETLLRSEQINQTQFQGFDLIDLAFLAMTQQRLGHEKEAEAAFQRLRERMGVSRWANTAEVQGFLREAEALLAKPKPPDDK